jgi:hypothetical protein
MRAFKSARFPLGLFLSVSPDRRVPFVVANAAKWAPARSSFLTVLLRALSAWGA